MITAIILALAVAAEDRGAQVALRECAACHSVGPSGDSLNSDAPTFRSLRLSQNPLSLEKRLTRLPETGHPAMPPRPLSAGDAADLVAYIQTLAPRTPGR